MLILAIVMVLVALLLLALNLLAKRFKKLMAIYAYLMRKMQYSALLRYIL